MKTSLVYVGLGLLLVGAACARSSEPARLLVRGATVQLVVASLEGLEATVTQRIAALDGFVARSERTEVGLTLVFRVPSARLEAALELLEPLSSSVDAREVHAGDA